MLCFSQEFLHNECFRSERNKLPSVTLSDVIKSSSELKLSDSRVSSNAINPNYPWIPLYLQKWSMLVFPPFGASHKLFLRHIKQCFCVCLCSGVQCEGMHRSVVMSVFILCLVHTLQLFMLLFSVSSAAGGDHGVFGLREERVSCLRFLLSLSPLHAARALSGRACPLGRCRAGTPVNHTR